jgi:hypothetical protein
MAMSFSSRVTTIRKKLPAVLSRPDFEMVGLDCVRRLGHDNHRGLCKVYSWGREHDSII